MSILPYAMLPERLSRLSRYRAHKAKDKKNLSGLESQIICTMFNSIIVLLVVAIVTLVSQQHDLPVLTLSL